MTLGGNDVVVHTHTQTLCITNCGSH